MSIEITKAFIKKLYEDESNIRISQIFNVEELIQITIGAISENLEKLGKQDRDILKAIDFTVDDLNQMYIENVKTRYILFAVCLYMALIDNYNEKFRGRLLNLWEIMKYYKEYSWLLVEHLYDSLFEDVYFFSSEVSYLRRFFLYFINIRQEYIRVIIR
ncbi:hypothetical protein, partial [Paenibacillus polymyxa]|uniref:hypothetical protein n=1 Tax=Paenibacillus polymyxa TaxID=1406 RepID=UPI0011119B99